MNRRGFLAMLAALPFVGKLVPAEFPTPTESYPALFSERNGYQECRHIWQALGTVYRQQFGFEETDGLSCARCGEHRELSPFHRGSITDEEKRKAIYRHRKLRLGVREGWGWTAEALKKGFGIDVDKLRVTYRRNA